MAIEVQRNVEGSRYEIRVDARIVGIAEYRSAGDTLVFPHTEIEASMRGQGLGAELVRAALDDVRADGGTVVPQCWYVAQFIDENPEYSDMLAAR